MAALPVGSLLTTILILIRRAIESNLVCDILSLDFPRVSTVEPEIGDFNLVSILNSLLKDTELVPDTVSPGWNLKRG